MMLRCIVESEEPYSANPVAAFNRFRSKPKVLTEGPLPTGGTNDPDPAAAPALTPIYS